ncbi:MAG: Fis family transcriptional regulator [Marinilabiliales bacterium]|nr:MAG: Fis family transcriptional regulator [Marinilabiliales bacterium]
MQDQQLIEHQGIIQDINNESYIVSILAQSACASCKVKGACSVSETQEKLIEVPITKDNYSIGEMVKVVLKQSLGFKALFLGYILPFLIIMFILIVLSILDFNEAIVGISAIVSLIPYYILLYKLKDRIKKQFSFSLRKMI